MVKISKLVNEFFLLRDKIFEVFKINSFSCDNLVDHQDEYWYLDSSKIFRIDSNGVEVPEINILESHGEKDGLYLFSCSENDEYLIFSSEKCIDSYDEFLKRIEDGSSK